MILLAVEVSDPSIGYSIIDVFFGINIFIMAVIVSLMIFIIIYRNHRNIRNSGLSSSILILIGLLFIEISVTLTCFNLNAIICTFIDIFLVVGISFVISTLAAKLYRIYRIFQNPTARAVHISDKDLFIFTCFITLGAGILFILYATLGGGLQALTKTADLNPLYEFKICLVPDEAIQITFLILFYVYFLSLFIAAGILAILTRKTMKDFNESWDVGFVVYSWIVVTMIYAPIFYLQGNSTNSNETMYAIRFIGITLVQILTLGFLFFNKVKKVIRSELKAKKSNENDQLIFTTNN